MLEHKTAGIKRLLARFWQGTVAERLRTAVIAVRMRDRSGGQRETKAEHAVVPKVPGAVGLRPAAPQLPAACVGDLEAMFAAAMSPDTEDAA